MRKNRKSEKAENAAKDAPTNETPTNETPTNETPTNEAPTNEAPTNEAPTNEAPTDEEIGEAFADIERERDARIEETETETVRTEVRRGNSDGVRASWNRPDVRASRSRRNGVEVNGIRYRSTRTAFRALRLPDSKHIPFRLRLKASGRESFGGYEFVLLSDEGGESDD